MKAMPFYFDVQYVPKWTKVHLLFCLLSLLVACGGGSNGKDDPQNSAFNLTESDFVVSSVYMLSATEFKKELNGTDEFLADKTDVNTLSPEENACMDDKLAIHSLKRVDDGTYELSINDTEFADCFVLDGMDLKSWVLSWYLTNLKLVDLDGNEVNKDNIPFNDEDNYIVLQSNSRVFAQTLGEITDSHTHSLVQSGSVLTFKFTAMISSNKTNHFDEPCQRYPVLNDCTYTEVANYSIVERPWENQIMKTVLNEENLNVLPDKQYFADGQILFDINNWSGTMTYQADASNPPSYTATDGAQTSSGTFEYNTEANSKVNKRVLSSANGNSIASLINHSLYHSLNKVSKVIAIISTSN